VIVVSDASPIISLSRVARLDLLRDLFGMVLLPPAVAREIEAGNGGKAMLGAAPWLEVRAVLDLERVRSLEQSLDAGEASAIVLALEIGAHQLLMDERRGREVAKAAGLNVTGLVGVALMGKRRPSSGHRATPRRSRGTWRHALGSRGAAQGPRSRA
jgi:predicted nucleic acid-binding protein